MDFSGKFVRCCACGETVFAQGSSGRQMFIVLSGRVEIRCARDGRESTLATLGKGEIFGEMALVDSGVRMASAVAVEDGTRLVVIDRARFVYIVSQQPAFALSVMRAMARRLQDSQLSGSRP